MRKDSLVNFTSNNLRRIVFGLMIVCFAFSSAISFAAENDENTVNAQAKPVVQIHSDKGKPVSADVKNLQEQVEELKNALENQNRTTNALLTEIKDLHDKQAAITQDDSLTQGYPANGNYLVDPGHNANANAGCMQDAVNSQGDSMMIFSYAPNQLYKIYCKLDYLTDIALRPGEPITFVGGGDTAKWMLDTSTLDGVAHLYLKPVAKGAKTNLIINTLHHSYQIICQEGDWYNPMIKWSYGTEDLMARINKQQSDSKIYSATVSSMDKLNFKYRVSGEVNWKPVRVFDDGNKTFIQFDAMPKKLPILFIRETSGHKEASLVNYRTNNNYIVVDRTFTEGELRSGHDIVKIKAGK